MQRGATADQSGIYSGRGIATVAGLGGGCVMKLYRIDKLAKLGGMVIKKKHILAASDASAVRQAENSADCPICDVSRDGETVGQVV
jgi:hypothetical protein